MNNNNPYNQRAHQIQISHQNICKNIPIQEKNRIKRITVNILKLMNEYCQCDRIK
jgi:hypothetical protein